MLSTPHVFKSQHHMDGEHTCRSGHPASLLIHHEPCIHSCSIPNYNSDGPYSLRYKRRPACRIQVSTPNANNHPSTFHFPLLVLQQPTLCVHPCSSRRSRRYSQCPLLSVSRYLARLLCGSPSPMRLRLALVTLSTKTVIMSVLDMIRHSALQNGVLTLRYCITFFCRSWR
jgi:hypothetical protein